MSSVRQRRSNRLIFSPWLNKRCKKTPSYVDLEAEDEASVEETISFTRNVNWGGGLGRARKLSGKADDSVLKDKIVIDCSSGKKDTTVATSSEDEDFVTPAEKFRDSNESEDKRITGKKRKQTSAKGKTGTVKRGLSALRGNQSKNGSVTKATGKSKSSGGRVQGTCTARAKVQRGNSRLVDVKRRVKIPSPKINEKGKKVRTYDNYIQKKFSPAIIRDVLENLSKEQFDWAVSSGFGDILNFRMEHYPHRLGYNVVDAFVEDSCSLVVAAGQIKITEEIVQKTIGLPRGSEKILYRNAKGAFDLWGKQFPDVKVCKVTPKMVRGEMVSSDKADENFKFNFLVMVYNFFIENNQGRYVLRDMVRFAGDIDNCGKYNWCGLLVDKLKKTHRYWVEAKKRNFTGPLPFLIYLYVSRVVNNETTRVPLKTPAYYGWSDMLLKERQNYELKNSCFGYGEILEISDDKIGGNENVMKSLRDKNREQMLFGEKCQQKQDVAERKELKLQDKLCQSDQLLQDNVDGHVRMELDNIEVDVNDDIVPDSEDIVIDEAGVSADSTMKSNQQDQKILKSLVQDKCYSIPNEEAGLTEIALGEAANRDNTKVSKVDPVIERGTQIRVGEEIDRHFAEEPYVEGFLSSLNQLDVLYKKCLTECVTTFALYPDNKRLANAKEEFPFFFKLFEETSPMTKGLCSASETRKKAVETEEDNAEFVPSFSLGLSQMPLKNLDIEMEGMLPGNLKIQMDKDEGKNGNTHVEGDTDRKEMVKGKSVECITERPRRGFVPAQVCRSPFVTRVVDVNAHKIGADEKDAWDWVMQNKRNKEEYLFEWNGRYCTKAHFQSLHDSKMVETTLIDTWSYILNENEILRSENSPLRLFLTTETTYGPLQLQYDPLSRYCAFDDHVDLALAMANEVHNKQYDVNDFDLFVFPIYTGAHHYLIAYDLRKPRCEILDNRVQTASIEETYGDLPEKLHDCFCQFLSCYDLPKYPQIQKLVPVVVSTAWQTSENHKDCGIFAMRHMETYMGNSFLWRSGLRTEKDNQKSVLNKLRYIYCHRLLTWSRNRRRNLAIKGMNKISKLRRNN